MRLAAIEPLVACAAFGFGKEADLLVIADRRNLHPGGLAQFSDGQHQIPLEAIVARDIKSCESIMATAPASGGGAIMADKNSDTTNATATVEWTVTGMDCAACATKIKNAVGRLPGVSDVNVAIMSERLKLTLADGATPREKIEGTVRVAWLSDRAAQGGGEEGLRASGCGARG